MTFKVGMLTFLVVGMLAGTACGATRILYWNIQDGMWDGQTDNFNRFVQWVQKQSPDICVFAEVRTKRQTGKTDHAGRRHVDHQRHRPGDNKPRPSQGGGRAISTFPVERYRRGRDVDKVAEGPVRWRVDRFYRHFARSWTRKFRSFA